MSRAAEIVERRTPQGAGRYEAPTEKPKRHRGARIGSDRSLRPPSRSTIRLVEAIVRDAQRFKVVLWDGTEVGRPDAPTSLMIRTPDAIARILRSPGELGIARAYVSGEIDLDGTIWDVVEVADSSVVPRITPSFLTTIACSAWEVGALTPRRLRAPSVEHRPRGLRHGRRRDADSVSFHYGISNDFYRLLLGSTMTYSCALFETPETSLDQAQIAKYDLVCRKLGLTEGMRLLDVGCGWGGMLIHAARTYGARAVGITVSEAQAELARERVSREGLDHLVEVRLQDYRDIDDGPFDAISSIGMAEHVGKANLDIYFGRLRSLLRPEGRLLNHAISRPRAMRRSAFARRSFMDRYVFPDAELVSVGQTILSAQRCGLEIRHVESLREHYALTLRSWVANLESAMDRAANLAGPERVRVWHLYMAGCAVLFERGAVGIDQVLAVRSDDGKSGMGLRPHW